MLLPTPRVIPVDKLVQTMVSVGVSPSSSVIVAEQERRSELDGVRGTITTAETMGIELSIKIELSVKGPSE